MILSDDDMALANAAGQRRFYRRRAAGSKHRWGEGITSPQTDIDACAAEIAVGRHLNKEWVETDQPDPDGDVGPGIQVRHTHRPNGHLLLHPDDHDHHRFYLVTGVPPELEVRGWVLAGDAKLPEFWRELRPGQPCFAVPQEFLHRRP